MIETNKIERLECVAPVCTSEQIIQQMGGPVALIGNGPLSKDYGSQIDNYATVIRINNFRLKGYEKQVGTKVTHWAHHGRIDSASLYGPWWIRMWVKLAIYRRFGVMKNPHISDSTICFTYKAFDWILYDKCKEYLHINLHFVEDASLLYALAQTIRYPTTGFSTLWLLLKFHESVDIYGFNGLQGGHYNNSKHRHAPRHIPTASREIQLIQNSDRVRVFN